MNPNLRLAQTFVDELAEAGVRQVCISPGSRSTPLTLAFYNHPDFIKHPLLDERSAAFFALGLAMASGQPTVLVCTSGSAAANYFPAIVEARMSHIPLLVLTADRPHELRGSGANQTIDQVKLYGDMVLLSVDMPLPEADPDALVERHIRSLVARLLAVTNGPARGPLHVNFPFRKPLEPAVPTDLPKVERSLGRPFSRVQRGVMAPTPAQVAELAEAIQAETDGLIVCGPQACGSAELAAALARLSQASGYPILADPLSGLRFAAENRDAAVLGAYDALLSARSAACPAPRLVLRFGAVPTSTALVSFLDKHQPLQVLINAHGEWADDTHRLSSLVQCDERLLVEQVTARLKPPPAPSSFLRLWQQLEDAAWDVLGGELSSRPLFDAQIVESVLDALPEPAHLFIGNSLAIRHADRFARPRPRHWQAWGTRGASGIDGNLSTALGIAASMPHPADTPVAALLGDISLLHDLNALHIPGYLGIKNITIVVNNNNGGGIFHRLPIHKFDPPFDEAFLIPHRLKFEHAAAMFDMAYTLVKDRGGLQRALADRFAAPARRAALIEVATDSHTDDQVNRELLQNLARNIT